MALGSRMISDTDLRPNHMSRVEKVPLPRRPSHARNKKQKKERIKTHNKKNTMKKLAASEASHNSVGSSHQAQGCCDRPDFSRVIRLILAALGARAAHLGNVSKKQV